MSIASLTDSSLEIREVEEQLKRGRQETVAKNLEGLNMTELYDRYVVYLHDANAALGYSFPIVSLERFEREMIGWAESTLIFFRFVENMKRGYAKTVSLEGLSHLPVLEGISHVRDFYRQHVGSFARSDHRQIGQPESGLVEFPRLLLTLQDPHRLHSRLEELEPQHRREVVEGFMNP